MLEAFSLSVYCRVSVSKGVFRNENAAAHSFRIPSNRKMLSKPRLTGTGGVFECSLVAHSGRRRRDRDVDIRHRSKVLERGAKVPAVANNDDRQLRGVNVLCSDP